MSTARYLVGDVFERMAELPDGSVDLVVTSPPFLALRSYLPADHPDKHKEIGSETTPADFLDTLLALTREWRRVLAPHGSICVELGDTYAGSGGGGIEKGDSCTDSCMREAYSQLLGPLGPAATTCAHGVRREKKDLRPTRSVHPDADGRHRNSDPSRRELRYNRNENGGVAWPLDKSLAGIPTLYAWSLAYGRNLLRPDTTIDPWRVRNLLVWARPNPPVGALGDKWRPATSYVTVACVGRSRYFDLDAVRTAHTVADAGPLRGRAAQPVGMNSDAGSQWSSGERMSLNPAGAPPLDWCDERDLDWQPLMPLPTQPFSGTTPTVHWVPAEEGASGDDIRRKVSPDCPRHGDLPGQLPKALRDAHAADSSTRTERSGARPARAQPHDSVPTDPPAAETTVQPGLFPVDAPAATGHSTGSHRTDHAPSTTQPCTPFAQTADDTARRSTPPESSATDHGTDVSRTSSDGSVASPEPQTPADTADIPRSERPCTCSLERRITERTSHYATFPTKLPARLIECMAPQRVCRTCGQPSRRITSDHEYAPSATYRGGAMIADTERVAEGVNQWRGDGGAKASVVRTVETLGWSDCGHDNWRPGHILDPFGGSGTTAVAATGAGRDCTLIDIDARNADLARDRVGMFLEVVA